MIADELLRDQLSRTLDETNLPELGQRYVGKVRDNYSRAGRRTIVVSDRLSAFDVVLGTIPWKGQVLNQLAAYWFAATEKLAPNHVIDIPDPNVLVAIECQPLPLELVMRSYLTGVTSTSIWRHYETGSRTFCGHKLEDGMKKNQRLSKVLLTPSTKAEKGDHDESVSRDEVIGRGLLDARTFDEVAATCAQMFAFGQRTAAERGLILVDTKYELGRTPEGKIVFIDEIHTPDSSRYWYADDYQARFDRGEEPRSLDKEYVRRHFASIGYTGDGTPPPIPEEVRIEAARRYVAAFEQVTGRTFKPDLEPPLDRIRRNLRIGGR
jgi:phosphoribosylaminoimidazole-succinocarboxamide synthase